MRKDILITCADEIEKHHQNEHAPYEYYIQEVTPKSEFSQCYTAFYTLPPHKSNYPYHYHEKNTEVFYIISGEGIIKTPDGERPIKTGNIIVCPPTAESAHKITNTSNTEPLVYLDVDTANSPDVTHYPDAGKTGYLVHNGPCLFFDKDGNPAAYYDGE